MEWNGGLLLFICIFAISSSERKDEFFIIKLKVWRKWRRKRPPLIESQFAVICYIIRKRRRKSE